MDDGTQLLTYSYDAWGNATIEDAYVSDGIDLNIAYARKNPFRYRGYYYDDTLQLYWLQTRYYDPAIGRFISPDDISYLGANGDLNSYNLYAYCSNNPVMYADPTGHMPEWAQWVVCGLAIAGLAVATVLTCGIAGAGAASVGAAMLAGGVISGGINAIDQLHDGGTFDWTELAISTISGTAYGMVVGLTGGTVGTWSWTAFCSKLTVAGGASLLNSWNSETNLKDTAVAFCSSLLLSSIYQGAGFGFGKVLSFLPKDPTQLLTWGDIASCLWSIPAIQSGGIRFVGGVAGAIFNDIY